MKSNKRKYRAIIIISAIICLIFQPIFITTDNPLKSNSQEELRFAAVVSGTKQWIENPSFDFPINEWYSSEYDPTSDLQANTGNNMANFTIDGDVLEFNEILGTPNSSTSTGWKEFNTPPRPLPNGDHEINDYGCNVSHYFYEEGGGQLQNLPGVEWKRNISIPVDMSDYEIISASLIATFNGSADRNVETPQDTLTDDGAVYSSLFDFARFYVEVSDLNDIESYEIASNQTIDLGYGDSPGNEGTDGPNYMYDTNMTTVDEDVLIYSLSQVLTHDNYNFTLILGITIDCEDNYSQYDRDTWYSLLIKSCNLTFAYRKKINQFTYISWNQDGKKISDLSPYEVLMTGANLNFKYKISEDWINGTSSLFSEIRVLLNGLQYPEAIKLSKANSTFQEVKFGGFDVISLIKNDVNISIQVYIGDNFELNHTINISINDVMLYISYTIFEPDASGGGGGKTKVIRTPDNTPVVIALISGIIALVAIFGAYQAHYKHPIMIRKIRKLKKKIKKGKTLKPLSVNKREDLLKNYFRTKTHKLLEEEILQPEIKVNQNKIEKGGN